MNQRSYEAAQQAIGIDLLTIPEPVQALDGLDPAELRALYPVQSDIYITALRSVARVMRANRRFGRTGAEVTPDESQDAIIQEQLAPERDRLKLVNGILHFIAQEDISETPYLKNQQRSIFGSLSEFFQSRSNDPEHPLKKRGRIKSPTGTGKTAVQAKIVEAAGYGAAKPPKTLILLPQKDDVAQTIGRSTKGKPKGFAKHAPHLKVTAISGKKIDTSSDVVVSTYGAFNHAIRRGDLRPEDFGLFIADEGHRAIGPVTKQNILNFTEKMPAVALSATMDFGLDHHVGEVFEEEIYSLDLREAVERSFVAPVKCMLYDTDVELVETKGSDFTQEEFDKLIDNESRNAAAVEFAKTFVQQGKSGLVACAPGGGARHAFLMAERISQEDITDSNGQLRKIRAVAVNGEMSTTERQDVYDAYEAGDIDVLTFVNLLNEGWDMECAKFLINLRPTSSPVLAEQRLGRILRGDELAIVVDFIDKTKRSQYLALHALGEYRYILGKVYGTLSERDAKKPIAVPERLFKQLQDISGKRINELVASSEFEAKYYPDRSLVDIALELKIHPTILAIVSKEIGVLTITNERDLVVNEVNVARIIRALETEKFSMLLNRPPQSLMHIRQVIFGNDVKLLFAINTDAEQYAVRLVLVEKAAHLQTVVSQLKQKIKRGELKFNDVVELVEIANYIAPTNTAREAFFNLFKNILDVLSAPNVKFLIDKLQTSGRVEVVSVGAESFTPTKHQHLTSEKNGAVVTLEAKIGDRPIVIRQHGKDSKRAKHSAYTKLIMETLRNSAVEVHAYSGANELTQDTALFGLEDTGTAASEEVGIDDKKLIQYFVTNRRISIVASDKKETSIQGVSEKSVTWTVKVRDGKNRDTEIEFTGTASLNNAATEEVRRQLVKYCVDSFGMPDSDVMVRWWLRELEMTKGKTSIPPQPSLNSLKKAESPTAADSLMKNASAPYVLDKSLVDFMGSDDPELFVRDICTAKGHKMPTVHYEIRGEVILAHLAVDVGRREKIKYAVGYSTDQRDAVRKSYLNFVKTLMTLSRNPAKYGELANYQNLNNAGFIGSGTLVSV